jgi:hypothetical protein
MQTNIIEPSCGLYYASEPRLQAAGQKTWITRSANVVVVISEVSAGTELARENNPDEYMLLLPPGVRAVVHAGAGSVEAGPESRRGDADIFSTRHRPRCACRQRERVCRWRAICGATG